MPRLPRPKGALVFGALSAVLLTAVLSPSAAAPQRPAADADRRFVAAEGRVGRSPADGVVGGLVATALALSGALLGAKTHRHERWVAALAEALNRSLQRLSDGAPLEEALQGVTEALVREGGFGAALVAVWDGQRWRPTASTPADFARHLGDYLERRAEPPISAGSGADGIRMLGGGFDGQSSVSGTVARDEAVWWVPLQWGRETLGALVVRTEHPNLNAVALNALAFVRQQLAALLALARCHAERTETTALIARLQERYTALTERLKELDGLDAKVWAVLEGVRGALGATRARFWRWNAVTKCWQGVMTLGETRSDTSEPPMRFPDRCPRYLALLERERCLVVEDARRDERVSELRAMWRDPVVAFAAVPVRAEDRLVAVLECEWDETLRKWHPAETTFLAAIADLLARLWLEDRWRKRERYLETLSRIALQLLVVTDWKGAVPAVLAELGTVLRVDAACLAVVADDQKLEPVEDLHEWAWDPAAAPQGEWQRLLKGVLDALAPFAHAVLKGGQPVGAPVSLLPAAQRDALKSLGVQSALLLPVFVESRLWGVLGFVQTRYERLWSDTDIAVLQVAASLLGSAVERQRATERQLEQERQFRDLFENAVVGIYRSTPDGYFLMANRALARINGYQSVAELMAQHIPTQIYANPEDRERFKRLMEEHGFVADFRYPIKRKDGSIGWVAKWARAVKDKDGKVLYYEGFVLDITEQVALSQRLQALQEIAHRLAMRLDVDSLVQVAVQELTRTFPDAAVVLLRYLPEERRYLICAANENGAQWLRAIGQGVGALLPERLLHPLEQRLRAGEVITTDNVSSATPLPASLFGQMQAVFLRGLGTVSEFWGALLVLRPHEPFAPHDLTFLNSFCDYLSVAVRNAVLFHQLQQAYEELRAMQERAMEQERLRALGQMASGIAHDINNALVPIQGFAELLLEHDDPTVQNAAQVIFKAARDITGIVQRMREFYRPRTGDELLEPLNLNALCQDALTMTRPRWHTIPQERGVVIEARLELSDDLPPVVGVPNEVRQALVNLILNACDAMPNGGVLTLRTYRAERGGRLWAVVEVCDTGVGMDEETRRRAVEPFFTTKGESGSGLGLSVVYGTMQRHDGLLEIDSALGKGTTVRLWFPSRVVAREASAVGEVPPLRLLLIDDEPAVREMIANLLRRDGHWVVTVPDGEQGVKAFEAALQRGEAFNAVITDLGMPRMDGFAVARAIKALSPSTPVILLSGWGFRLREDETRDIVDAVLTKPATHQQLRRALARACGQQ